MRLAYLDCFAGISGNMALAAAIDAGASAAAVRKAAKAVVPDFTLAVKDDTRRGIGGKHVTVRFKQKGQPHRRLGDIEAMIKKSGLPERVRRQSLQVFATLADAEARVHRISPEQVHFHEVGAIDAIVDVVGTVAALHALGIERVVCSPLPMSSGEVECAHGILPVPAPATMEMLKDVPVRGVPIDAELVTPTGAALATTLADAFGPMPAITVKRVGVGLGDRELDRRPNLMRLIVGERAGDGEVVIQFEAAIDDMPAEHFDFLLKKLQDAGALETLFVPAQMKKNRPGTLVRTLAPALAREKILDAFFNHSTTLGVRTHEVERAVLPREIVAVKTRYGKVRVKLAPRPDGSVRSHVEYDDLQRAAAKSGDNLETVEAEVKMALAQSRGEVD